MASLIVSVCSVVTQILLLLFCSEFARATYPRNQAMFDSWTDPIDLAPFTNDNTSVRVPDMLQWGLLRSMPDFTSMPRLSNAAVKLFNRKFPQNNRSRPLYDAQKLLDVFSDKIGRIMVGAMVGTAPADAAGIYPRIAPANSSIAWTTLAGLSFSKPVLAPGIFATYGCKCNERPEDMARGRRFLNHTWAVQLGDGLQLAPEDAVWDDDSIPKTTLCTPQMLARGRIRLMYSTKLFPVTKDVLKAMFDMTVDVLRDESAVPILESMKIAIQDRDHDKMVTRMIKVAGLPESAIGNMRRFLLARQYGLYQALHRSDNDCPISPTDCGKFGPDPCDHYPPVRQ